MNTVPGAMVCLGSASFKALTIAPGIFIYLPVLGLFPVWFVPENELSDGFTGTKPL